MNAEYQFNQPIKRLLLDFEDKRSGKVVESRREIRRRFDYLDRPQQVRFLKACFQSCRSDREWAYDEVTKHWDPKFLDIISDLWYEHSVLCDGGPVRECNEVKRRGYFLANNRTTSPSSRVLLLP